MSHGVMKTSRADFDHSHTRALLATLFCTILHPMCHWSFEIKFVDLRAPVLYLLPSQGAELDHALCAQHARLSVHEVLNAPSHIF